MITIGNSENVQQDVQANVYDATTGAYIKTLIVPMPPNTSTGFWEADFEKLLGWQPSPGQLHITIVFSAAGKPFSGNVDNEVANVNLLTYVNMSQVCPTW